jgi:hypothetical protein
MYLKLDKSKNMKKVYLAKSNKANPNIVSAVRQTLAKFEIEIVEFTGGQYSHDLLLCCETLIVIPDLSNVTLRYDEGHGIYNKNDNIYEIWSVPIGKGLYEQIRAFNNQSNNTIMVTGIDCELNITGVYYDSNWSDYYKLMVVDEQDYVKFLYKFYPLKDESWVSNALTESIKDHKTHIVKNKMSKFMVLLSKK